MGFQFAQGGCARLMTTSPSRLLLNRLFMGACVLAVAAHGVVVAYLRPLHLRDFDTHREVGRRFLTGEYLYAGGACYPYLPTGTMPFVPLALVDRSTGLALRYTVAIASLCLVFSLLYRMVRDRSPERTLSGFTLGALTSAFALQFLLIDLDDGGPHTILLAILVGAVYAVWRKRETLGAILFGLAIALKVSTALFLPFFIWKRKGRLASYSTIAALCWVLLPMPWMGPASWWAHHVEWTRVAVGSFVGERTAIAKVNEDRIRNSGLRQGIMRYVANYPDDHPLRTKDPGYVPVLNLDPVKANTLAMAVLVLLLAVFCWQTRHPYGSPTDPDWVRDASAIMVLMLLISPVTWVQHLVWLVPGIYVIVDKVYRSRPPGPFIWAAVVAYVMLAMILNMEILGWYNYQLVLSWKPYTMAMLLVLALLMAWRPSGFERPTPAREAFSS